MIGDQGGGQGARGTRGTGYNVDQTWGGTLCTKSQRGKKLGRNTRLLSMRSQVCREGRERGEGGLEWGATAMRETTKISIRKAPESYYFNKKTAKLCSIIAGV
jgi:hypothetical protein